MLFIYFQGKIKFSRCIWLICCFEFLFWFSSDIFLSKMKSPFFSLWKFSKFLMSFLEVQVNFPSNFASIVCPIKHNYVLFGSKLYTLVKKSALKCKFPRLLSARVKICQIPHITFETTSKFLFKFCITLQCHERWLPFTDLSQSIYTFLKRNSLK